MNNKVFYLLIENTHLLKSVGKFLIKAICVKFFEFFNERFFARERYETEEI